MTDPIPVTADDVDTDFDRTASPAPGAASIWLRRGVAADLADPGHLATIEEWTAIVQRAEGRKP